MLNLGTGEVLLILVIALLVLGPDRLPGAMRQAGRAVGELRRMSSGFQSELRDALHEPVKGTPASASTAADPAGETDPTGETDSTTTPAPSAEPSSPPATPDPSTGALSAPAATADLAAPADVDDHPSTPGANGSSPA